MQEKLFHDRKQSLRVFLIDAVVYLAIYTLLVAVGYTDITVLILFHGSIFHIICFHLDAFGPVLLDRCVHRYRKRMQSPLPTAPPTTTN
jgi:hypothetical protein